MLEDPISGQISEQLTDFLENNLKNCEYDFEDILTAVKTHPRAGAAFELLSLFSAARAGRFTHPHETANDLLSETINRHIKNVAAESVTARLAGFSTHEFVHESINEQWMLTGLPVLRPDHVTFETEDNKTVTHLTFNAGDDIPMAKVIHVVAGRHLAFGNPYGCAHALRVMSLVDAWRLSMNMWAVAAQRNSTPLTHWIVDEDAKVKILGADGRPLKDEDGNEIEVSAVPQLKETVEDMQTSSNFIVTTDKVSSHTINTTANSGFFETLCHYLDKGLFTGLLIPETILESGEGGLGNGGLSEQHMKTLLRSVDATNGQLHEQFLEKITGPLIRWNLGDAYLAEHGPGKFEVDPDDENLRIDLLNAIVGALSRPTVGLHTQGVVDRAYDLLGIPRQEGITESLLSNNPTPQN